MILEESQLTRITTDYDASKKFKNLRKVFFRFYQKGLDKKYFNFYEFNPNMTFSDNLQILKNKFKHLEGRYTLFTNNQLYPKIKKTNLFESKYKQLEMF